MKIPNPQIARNHRILPAVLPLALLLFSFPVEAAEFTYQYFRFTTTKLRSGPDIQLSEFRFRLGTTLVTGATPTAPGGNSPANEGVANLVDGSLTTKWFSSVNAPLVFTFSAPVTVDNYSFATGNDSEGRDPVSWTLEGSEDGTSWLQLDVRANYATTINRNVWVDDFTIPAELPPAIREIVATPSVVINGQTADIEWDEIGGNTLTLNPAPAGGADVTGLIAATVTPAANQDTAYTLSSANSAATVTASATVRAVAGGSINTRYVRFTPVLLRGGNTLPIQLDEFEFLSGATEVVPVSVTNVGGSNAITAAEGANNLINNATDVVNPDTGDVTHRKWLDGNRRPVVFDFGSVQSIDSYRITTANDVEGRDPIRWTLEGSTDGTTFFRIDDLSSFDFNVPRERWVAFTVPLPGGTLPPLATLAGDAVKVFSGDPLKLTWTTSDAATVTISPAPGTVTTNGTVSVFPTADTTYTLTASSPAGYQVQKTFAVQVTNSPNTTIAYSNFDIEAGELSLVGFASVLNDFANIPLPGDAKRLRLIPDVPGRSGAAWFSKRQPVVNGFDTTFSFQFTKSTNFQGADGLAFIVQDSPLGNGGQPVGENGFADRDLAVKIDTYQNAADSDPSAASLQIRAGSTILQTVNLVGFPGITVNTTVSPQTGLSIQTLTTLTSGAPHTVRVLYAAGTLNVWFDGVQVITNLAVNLTTINAVNADGNAFVGFASRSGGYSQNADITSWSLTTGTAPAAPLAITAYTINPATGQGSLTWTSTSGKTYRITGSGDLLSFPTELATGIPATGAVTTSPFTFTAGTKGFFRVEEVP